MRATTIPTLNNLPPPPLGKTGWPWTEEPTPLPDRMPDGSEWPRISIVTPNYNYGHFLEETLRSVLLQGYPNLEYIVIDGGSKDNSVEIIKKYEPWLSYWISEKDQGQASAINRGFEKASGELFYWINSDDLLSSETLQKAALFFKFSSSTNFFSGNGYYFTEVDNIKSIIYNINPRNYSFQDLLRFYDSQYLPQPSVFFSRSLWESSGGLNSSLTYAMDLDLWLRFIRHTPLLSLQENFSQLRLHDDSKTCLKSVFLMEEIRQVILNNSKGLSLIQYCIHYMKINSLYANFIQRRSLIEYNSGEKIKAIKWFVMSLKYWPLLLLYPSSLKILLKLTTH